jgi:threonine dehydratase
MFGAEVVLHGETFDESYAFAQALCEERAATFVPTFDHPHIIAGQGTVALELLEQVPAVDVVMVPIGGGGLIAGMGAVLKTLNPRIRIVGVEAAAVPSMKLAVEQGGPVVAPAERTVADGIAVRKVGALTYDLTMRYVDDIVTVSETEIAQAILQLLEDEKIVAEGSGAASVAAMMQGLGSSRGKRVCCVVSGGNIDVNLLSLIIERGLVAQGRRVQVDVVVPDRPGSLRELTRLVAEHQANVLQVYHDRMFREAPLGDTVIEMVLETRGREHAEQVVEALRGLGHVVTWKGQAK